MARIQTLRPLSASLLLGQIRNIFQGLSDHRQSGKKKISLVDALMSGRAMFGLKFSSLLKFDEHRTEVPIRHNLKTLYGVEQAPCDTQLREILDPVEPASIHSAYQRVFQLAQEAKVLEPFRFCTGSFLISIDGTGEFCSSTIRCPDCAIKETRNGDHLYHHQLLAAVLVHPDRKQVIPFVPEPIVRGDGGTKNDCEQNAAKRLLTRLREQYPTLPITIVQDALYAKGPHIKLLKRLSFSYIISVKEGDHAPLFEAVRRYEENDEMEGITDYDEKTNITRLVRFVKGLSLNKSHPDLKVNFLEYIELEGQQVRNRFTWITDLTITEANCVALTRGGRARWKIENETFNTLKNQGYQLEHNYGHGKTHLSTHFALLMMLAFLVDQIQELTCPHFQQARRRVRSRTSLWERMRALFIGYFIDTWETLWHAISQGHRVARLQPIGAEFDNTS